MPYPIVSRAEARTYLVALRSDPDTAAPEPHPRDDGPDEKWEVLGTELSTQLMALTKSQKAPDADAKGGEFEIAAGPVVHRLLPSHPALADPEFWVWLAVVHCLPAIQWRYKNKPDLKNFGVGSASENFLYRLWLRSEIGYDAKAKDAYERARFGDIDFWRSHVFRQGYGEVRPFVRAFLNFQFPESKERKARLKTDQIRELAKGLKRARTNLMFELMDEKRAGAFIQSEWSRLAADKQ